MRYFAYGSNMLTARIHSRCRGTKAIGRASLAGYTLRFDKRSSDGSAKCAIHSTSNPHDIVHGVLFEVPQAQVCRLDAAEGEGTEYERRPVRVEVENGEVVPAETYFAKEAKIDAAAKPYDWYLDLVIAGALTHELPETYVAALRNVQAKPDPHLKRPDRLQALEQLGKAG
jgi:gamma-glutamylcyclotransferase